MVAASHWFIQTGSCDEKPKEAGFAHFLEHMLFKDATAKETGIASTGKMARVIEGKGGDLNAYTSFDQTVYHVTCADRYWEEILDEWGSIAHHQKFLRGDFEREREVILEELRRSLDSPSRTLYQSLFTHTFGRHPYGRPVIGYAKILKAAKVSELESFFRRRYVPSRMGLVLAGPVGPENSPRRKRILAILEKRFGSKAIPKREASPEPARAPIQALVPKWKWEAKGHDVKSPTLALSFRGPDHLHPDLPAMDLGMNILGSGETSRLYQQLFYRRSLVTEVSSFLYALQDGGMACIQAELDSVEKAEPALKDALTELVRLRTEGPTTTELERVVAQAESERHYATQTVDSMASRLGHLRFVLGDLSYDRAYLEAVRETNFQAVRDVFAANCTADRMSGVLLVPKSQAHIDVSPLRELAVSTLGVTPAKPKKTAKKSKTLEGKPEIMTLSNGTRVAYLERPYSPVFSLHACALGGVRLEQADPVESSSADAGASSLLAMTWTKGTFHKDAKSIAEIVEGKAASLEGFSGRHSAGLQLTGLPKDWDTLSDLFTEVLLEPMFREEELEHSKRVQEDSIRSVEDHTSQLCSKLFLETLFEKHPYGRFSPGTLESVKAMTPAKLRRFHQKWIRPERLVLSLSGKIRPKQLEAFLNSLNDRFSSMTAPKEAPPPSHVDDEPMLKSPRWVERALGREQLHILIGTLGITMRSPERFAIRLLQNILGGQGGRLFVELREKKSLAYTVSPMEFEGMERGYIGTYIACSPSKKAAALEGIRAVLGAFAKKGPPKEELLRAKEYYLGHRAMDLQGDSSLASHYGLQLLYGFQPEDEDKALKSIEKVTPEDVRRACERFYVEPPMVTALVG